MEKYLLKTKDYNMFKLLTGNRDVQRPHVEKIKQSIKNVGYITSPIIVNEKMEVIEGQHRLKAFSELGVEVEYIIHPGAGIKECIAMNIIQEKWKLCDYINCFAKLGNENYIFLNDMIGKYQLPIDTIIAVCGNTISFVDNIKVKEGSFELRRSQNEIEEIFEYVKSFECYSKNFLKPFKIAAQVLVWAYTSEEIDEERLREKISKNYQMLTPFTDVSEFLATLEIVYNYKARGSHVYFKQLYDAYAESKSFFNHRLKKEHSQAE